jgi:hypothetical protein
MISTARVVCLVAFFASTGCGAKMQRIGASAGDYGDYRAFRVAPALSARMKAASLYLQCHSEGAFRLEVADWFAKVEPLFFEALADSATGMQTYLDALPAGPHAESAVQRRDAFLAAARAEAGERLSAKGADIERRLAAASQSREDVLTAYAAWVGRLIDFDAWGRNPKDASADFGSAWTSEPPPKCDKKRCSKLLTTRYELEVRGKPESFVSIFEVSLRLSKKGKVAEATVSGPDLFSSLAEAHEAEPVGDTAEGRTRAIKYVIQLTTGAIERRLDKARCGRNASPPAVMLRECEGYRVKLIPKTTTVGEDRVVIRGPSGL